ncbi:MAG: polyphenol oxidase family protein [Acidobacteria bacterium]|nr:polyphenol oxidase family protein [Acidobacteriota bacterium]MBV9478485.1 polyphenol oxidase family protein [Acidobacteriota bacterium]
MWTIEPSSLGRIAVPPQIPDGFAVFCTTRDYPGKIVADELTRAIAERFSIDASLTTCVQVHGAHVVRARRENAWRECDSCDALWSDEMHTALGIKVADCLPVTMIDPLQRVMANVHSGWRGAVQRITAETLDALTRETRFDAAQSFAYLGPSIRACCFEVGEEVASRFDEQFVDRSRAKPHVDLVAFTAALLRERGVTRISDSELCTRCDGSIFHSFRRDGKGGGRNLMLVAQ